MQSNLPSEHTPLVSSQEDSNKAVNDDTASSLANKAKSGSFAIKAGVVVAAAVVVGMFAYVGSQPSGLLRTASASIGSFVGMPNAKQQAVEEELKMCNDRIDSLTLRFEQYAWMRDREFIDYKRRLDELANNNKLNPKSEIENQQPPKSSAADDCCAALTSTVKKLKQVVLKRGTEANATLAEATRDVANLGDTVDKNSGAIARLTAETVCRAPNFYVDGECTKTLDFDDIYDPAWKPVPDGYKGLKYSNMNTEAAAFQGCDPSSGFAYGATSYPSVVANADGGPGSIYAPSGVTVSFFSLRATPGYYDDLALVIEGYRGYTLVNSTAHVLPSYTEPTLVTLDGFIRKVDRNQVYHVGWSSQDLWHW